MRICFRPKLLNFQQPKKALRSKVVRATWAPVRSSIERWQFEVRLVLSAGSTH